MALKYIRLYIRLVVRSSFLAKWLGEKVRVRAKEWLGERAPSIFFLLSFLVFLHAWFSIINEAFTRHFVKLHHTLHCVSLQDGVNLQVIL